jgi:hypothetical protein
LQRHFSVSNWFVFGRELPAKCVKNKKNERNQKGLKAKKVNLNLHIFISSANEVQVEGREQRRN